MVIKIGTFIEKMKEKYGDSVIVQKGTCDIELLKQLPEPLKEFYSEYESAEFPFGCIYPASVALEESVKTETFHHEGWFCFGFDGYFSYWLCSFQPDHEDLWITSWDHDSDCEREGVYASLIEFLEDMEEDYEG